MGGCEPCTHVVHPTINQTLTSSSVSCSCIRCSLHTPVLTIIHDLHLMSHNVVSSCHVAGISSRSGHACFFSTQCTSTHIVTYASPNQAALEDLSSSGRDAVVCMQRLLKRTGYWSASVVRIDLLQAPMPAAGGKTAANQADRASIVPKFGGSREASQVF
jgi:hypothetical protein